MLKAIQKFGAKVFHHAPSASNKAKGKAPAAQMPSPAGPSPLRFCSPPLEDDADAIELVRPPEPASHDRYIPPLSDEPAVGEDAEAGPSQQSVQLLPPYSVVSYKEFGSRPDLRRFQPFPGQLQAASATLLEDQQALGKSLKARICQTRKLGTTEATAELVTVLWHDHPKTKTLEAVAPRLHHPVIIVSA